MFQPQAEHRWGGYLQFSGGLLRFRVVVFPGSSLLLTAQVTAHGLIPTAPGSSLLRGVTAMESISEQSFEVACKHGHPRAN